MEYQIKLTRYKANVIYPKGGGSLVLGTAGSYGTESIAVEMDESWDDMIVTATYQPCGVSRLVDNGKLSVPAKATAKQGKGVIVFAGAKDGTRRITVDMPYIVLDHAESYLESGASVEPTVVEKILNAALASKSAATASEKASEAAQRAAQSVLDDADAIKEAAKMATTDRTAAEKAKADAEAAAKEAKENAAKSDASNKIPSVVGAKAGNVPLFDDNGNLVDSGSALIQLGVFTGDADSIDDVPINSVWWISNTAKNNPVAGWAMMETWGGSDGTRVQRFTTYTGSCVAYRLRSNGVWGNLYWDNPRMMPGVEYLTTRKHHGQDVYAKAIQYTMAAETGTSSGVTTIQIPHGISGFSALVECTAEIGNRPMPIYDSNGNSTSVLIVGTTAIQVRIFSRVWPADTIVNFELWYTKT